MLVSSPKPLGMFLTFLALMIIFLIRHHVAYDHFKQTELGYTYKTSDQTVLGTRMTSLQETLVYDQLSGDTPSNIESNWSATVAAKSLLQKVRESRIRMQASYNEDSKKGVRRMVEDAELELGKLGEESFDTKKIVKGVQKLRAALKAAEEVSHSRP